MTNYSTSVRGRTELRDTETVWGGFLGEAGLEVETEDGILTAACHEQAHKRCLRGVELTAFLGPSFSRAPAPAARTASSDFPKCPFTETVFPRGPQQHRSFLNSDTMSLHPSQDILDCFSQVGRMAKREASGQGPLLQLSPTAYHAVLLRATCLPVSWGEG